MQGRSDKSLILCMLQLTSAEMPIQFAALGGILQPSPIGGALSVACELCDKDHKAGGGGCNKMTQYINC